MLAVIGNKPVKQVTTEDCMRVLKPVEAAGHLTKLEKMRSMMSQTIAYAIATGRTKENPCIHVFICAGYSWRLKRPMRETVKYFV